MDDSEMKLRNDVYFAIGMLKQYFDYGKGVPNDKIIAIIKRLEGQSNE